MKLSSDQVIDLTQSSSLSSDRVLVQLIRDLLGRGKECRFQVKGYSMSPFIKEGDVVTIAPMSDAAPGFGNVIAFIHPRTEKLIIHRVVGKIGDACLLKGENAAELDGLVERNRMIGIITRVERKSRKVFLGLGPERFLIALLTRKNLLLPILRPARRMFDPIARIFFRQKLDGR